MARLVPCPACARHVRSGEAACPFCAAALPRPRARLLGSTDGPPAPALGLEAALPGRRLRRAALFFFGATLTLAACSGSVSEEKSSSGLMGGTGGGGGGPDDDGGTNAHYGGPAFDAGPDDDGGNASLYGDPPPPDAGTDASDDAGDAGMWQGPYGSPPPPPDGL